MAKRRVTLPQNALGPVSRPGDKMRIQDKVIADAQAKARSASKAKPASESVRGKAPSTVKRKPLAAYPNRAGASFTPGSKADMAYTGVKVERQAAKAAGRMHGAGKVGAVIAAGAAANAAYDKLRQRKRAK